MSGAEAADRWPSVSADRFRDAIGVNVHMAYTDTAYAQVARVREALDFVGIRHLRDVMPTDRHVPGRHGRQALSFLGRQGFGIVLVMPPKWTVDEAMRMILRQAAGAPGSIAAIEGYNEIGNFPVSFEGGTGLAAAERGQSALYEAVKAHPDLAGVPVYDMTGREHFTAQAGLPPPAADVLAGQADVANRHPYPQNGKPPGTWIRAEGFAEYDLPAEFPKVITEFGYASLPQSGWLVIGVDERTQAKGLLAGLLDAISAGYVRTYLYELLDQKPDPDGDELQFHFGLFRNDFQPKPAAIALRRLQDLLGDTAAGSGAAALEDTAPAGVDPVRALDVTTAAGGLTILWREQDFWNRETGTPIEAAAVDVTVRFGRACAEVLVSAPIDDDGWRRVAEGVDSAVVGVADAPVLVTCR
jgi:hypothetical protein